MSQQYNTPPSQGAHQPGYGPNPNQMRGEQLAQTSMIMGIIGLFVAGIILGPLAIWKAKQAEELNVAATVGKVTGWIATILNVLGIIGGIIYVIVIMGMISEGAI